jgi:hypothetical protein
MIEQLMGQATVKPEVLAGKEDGREFGIEEFCMLANHQQKETMSKHVQRITKDLEKIKKSYEGRDAKKLRNLQIQALEWCDSHRAKGSCFGQHSIDLKLRWRLVKYDKDGKAVMTSEWFTCYTIALGGNFEDPRTPMDASDLWGTVSDKHGKTVTSKKLSKILDEAPEHYGFQGLSKHADLKERAKVLVGNRVAIVWAPDADEVAAGWTVETMFSEFCYQDSGSNAEKNGPVTYGAVFGPKGSSFYTGYAGQLDLPYKWVDEKTDFLMNYPVKVEASDRKVEEDGSVREQTMEEKAAVLAKDSTSAVQVKIGVNGTQASSNQEFVLFGRQKPQPTIDLRGASISADSRPWQKREPYMTPEQLAEWRKAEAEREAKRRAAELERQRKHLEMLRLQKVKDLKESCNNAASRPAFFAYFKNYLLEECAKHEETKDCTEWLAKGDKALAEARANAEPFEIVDKAVDPALNLVPDPMALETGDEPVYSSGGLCPDSPPPEQDGEVGKEPASVTDEEVANFTFADLTGEKYKIFTNWRHAHTLNDANVGNMDAYFRRILSIIKQGKNPDDPTSWGAPRRYCSINSRSDEPFGMSGKGGWRSLSADGKPHVPTCCDSSCAQATDSARALAVGAACTARLAPPQEPMTMARSTAR